MDQLYKAYTESAWRNDGKLYAEELQMWLWRHQSRLNLKSIMDYDIAKDKLFIRVSSAETNKDSACEMFRIS